MADCLVLVTNCFSTQTSYENQTKKSINNRFIQEAMTEFFRSRLQVYFLENKQEADRIAEQVLINKRSRETAERARITVKKKLSGNLAAAAMPAAASCISSRAIPPWARSSSRATRNFRASCPSAARSSTV